MTLHAASPRCVCSQCAYFRARVMRGRQRMGLTPLYSPPLFCRHRGGTDDCETACWDIFGDSFHTIPLYSPAAATRDAAVGGSSPKNEGASC